MLRISQASIPFRPVVATAIALNERIATWGADSATILTMRGREHFRAADLALATENEGMKLPCWHVAAVGATAALANAILPHSTSYRFPKLELYHKHTPSEILIHSKLRQS